MATIERPALEFAAGKPARWDRLAAQTAAWVGAAGLAWRDVVVLVPFAQLLAPARAAFARGGVALPRVETTHTLAAALGPPALARPGELAFDPVLDALNASALLRSQATGAAWVRRDPRAFEQGVRDVVVTAQQLARAAAALPPARRPAHWAAARDRLGPVSGPGATERWLARIALEWASAAPAPATDRLFTHAGVAGWVVVVAGGAAPLVEHLLHDAPLPCLWLDTDAAAERAIEAPGAIAAPAQAVCDSFEDEAQAAAAQVLRHIEHGQVPVALIAQDRVLVRRVRALLERQRVRLLDETGWTLSTTRAAAQVMGLLRAAAPDATTDMLIDWLKSGPLSGGAAAGRDAVASLEATCRRDHLGRVAALPRATLEAAAARLWNAASEVLAGLREGRRQPLGAWLHALSTALRECGAWDDLRGDDAGRQLLAALRLHPPAGGAWLASAAAVGLDLPEFRQWVDAVLEQATFVPSPAFDAEPEVVVTPLARAMLRPFAAVVLPGADDRRLGAARASESLLGDALAVGFGVPTAADARRAEWLAFAQLLALPQLTLLRRRVDEGEPLVDSPLVERLALALARQGRALAPWHDPRERREVATVPVHMTAPAAPALLPASLSASACEALRACPYRFFALRLLQLREDDELEREVGKRDYGTWLHAVLFEFHRQRAAPASAAIEQARLMEVARMLAWPGGADAADALPFVASFEHVAPRYIAWLHRRDAAGARWLAGEEEHTLALAGVDGIELRGIIDRIDEHPIGGAASAIDLIDYKTGGATKLREQVAIPLEDTQLAFYAALVGARR
ncbi:MAG TPA: PD-(D/E)XK nuclease family protein, partial [Burkholderiaceae bacterium]|nr:PD-(D/E)XK nuclease family protein [Burkholderiaceae bacterium]